MSKKIVIIKKHKSSNLVVRIFLILFVFVLINLAIASVRVYYKGKDKGKEIVKLQKKLWTLEEEKKKMIEEKKDLMDPSYQEGLAREQGMIRKGEILFKIVPKKERVKKTGKKKEHFF